MVQTREKRKPRFSSKVMVTRQDTRPVREETRVGEEESIEDEEEAAAETIWIDDDESDDYEEEQNTQKTRKQDDTNEVDEKTSEVQCDDNPYDDAVGEFLKGKMSLTKACRVDLSSCKPSVEEQVADHHRSESVEDKIPVQESGAKRMRGDDNPYDDAVGEFLKGKMSPTKVCRVDLSSCKPSVEEKVTDRHRSESVEGKIPVRESGAKRMRGEVSDVVVEQDVDGNKGAEITKKPLESRKRKSVEEEIFSKKDRRDDIITMLFTNLPEGTNDDKLVSFLKKKNIHCQDRWTNFGKCKAYIDVRASYKERAIGLHQVKWDGCEISVEEIGIRHVQVPSLDKRHDVYRRSLYVRNLPLSASKHDVTKIFKNVEKVVLFTRAGRPRGKGYIIFNDPAALDKAMETKDEYKLDGRRLYLDYCDNRSKRYASVKASKTNEKGKPATILVKKLPPHAAKKDLMAIFENVEKVSLLSDSDTGESSGIAFVHFNDTAAMEKAMKTKDKYELDGHRLFLDYYDSPQ